VWGLQRGPRGRGGGRSDGRGGWRWRWASGRCGGVEVEVDGWVVWGQGKVHETVTLKGPVHEVVKAAGEP